MQRFSLEVKREAERLIRRHEERARDLMDEHGRRQRRSTVPSSRPKVHRPARWSVDPGFNPYLVRSRHERIGHSIKEQLRDRSYSPRSPIEYSIPKSGGGERQLSIFQVADSAVSRVFYENILAKNLPLMGPRSYAYRKDVSAQDAIQHVRASFNKHTRVFLAEYDFRKFFDNIEHEHIRRSLHDNGFLLTSAEQHVIDVFLATPPSPLINYVPVGSRPRSRGVAQGTSISLFLANIAAWELDRDLEQMGVGFTRYADDTLIWSVDYSTICRAAEAVYAHAQRMGVDVNSEKSPGITLLCPSEGVEKAEIRSKSSIEYLGYQIGLSSADIKSASIDKIKCHIEDLLYRTLLSEPIHETQALASISGTNDHDYVTYIWQLRRYLYGDLKETSVRRFQTHAAPMRRFKGVMSAYPLIDDTDVLRQMDRWLATKTWVVLRQRRLKLEAAGLPIPEVPYGIDYQGLASLTSVSDTTGNTVDLRLPSFRRIARVIQRAANLYGPGLVGQGQPGDY